MNKQEKNPQLNKEFYTIGEVAQILNVHIDTLRRWDKAGKLKPVRIGDIGWRRYRKVDIENILNLN
ncbi:MerR family transcriptional regulator [Candidatus Dojkabacteria bacterium]|nr:MerR family transcriptional regulator [Candidatus Dojkabacteria bacterium]